jgi:tRNA(fMet)-specific endonuclease VapC
MKCLDTTFLIDLTRDPTRMKALADEVEAEGAVTTEISVFELYAGAYRDGRPVQRLIDAADGVLRRLEILPLSRLASRKAAELSSHLRARGEEVGALDVLIAAIALVHGVNTVMTRDPEDFRRIPGLRVETY